MTIRTQVALSAFLLLGFMGPATVRGQGTVPAPSGGINVALIDISYVFKNHPVFQQRTEEIKKEVKDFEDQMNNQRKALNDKRARLAEFKVGSPEYERLEAELANEVTKLELAAGQKRRDVLDREARIYYETYQDVYKKIADFCALHRISLVLRYDSEPIDAADRASVLRGVNRAVVYQDRIDITQEIVRAIGGGRAASNVGRVGQPGVAPR